MLVHLLRKACLLLISFLLVLLGTALGAARLRRVDAGGLGLSSARLTSLGLYGVPGRPLRLHADRSFRRLFSVTGRGSLCQPADPLRLALAPPLAVSSCLQVTMHWPYQSHMMSIVCRTCRETAQLEQKSQKIDQRSQSNFSQRL